MRAGDTAAVGADGAHHLELFVDDHEQLFGLLRRLEELRQRLDGGPAVGMAEGPRDRIHRDHAVACTDMRLRARAHRDVAGGHDGERPVRTPLVLEGVHTTIPFLLTVLDHPDFIAGDIDTKFLERMVLEKAQPV